jgi:hypothetical protein
LPACFKWDIWQLHPDPDGNYYGHEVTRYMIMIVINHSNLPQFHIIKEWNWILEQVAMVGCDVSRIMAK